MDVRTGLLCSLDLSQDHCQAQEIFWDRLILELGSWVLRHVRNLPLPMQLSAVNCQERTAGGPSTD